VAKNTKGAIPDLSPADLLAELERRKAVQASIPEFLAECFPEQRAFIEDPSRLKASLCTRRAGKSMAAALYLLKEAYEHPGASLLYIALTRESAKRIIWKDCLKVLDRRLNLGVDFAEHSLEARLPNGSIIYVCGADADPRDAERFLGQKYRLVVIDEAGSFRQNLDDIVYGILRPAMGDLDGTIALIGTPSNLKTEFSLYYRVTSGNLKPTDAKWSVHFWSAKNNPHMKSWYENELDRIDRENPLFRLTAYFAQYMEGRWVVDDSKLVYAFDRDKNIYTTIPPANYRMVLGVDLGHSPDPSAFSLLAYSPHDPNAYVVDVQVEKFKDFTDVANIIKDFQRRYEIDEVVIDGSNKQGVAEMSNRHDLTLIATDKRGLKVDSIELMNADFIQRKIKIYAECEPLIEEYEHLTWDETTLKRSGKRKEHPGLPNHAADATLYAWRHCFHYLATIKPEAPKPGTPEWQRAEEARMEQVSIEQHRPRQPWEAPPDLFSNDPFPT
jgi:PBSX family phage terminase large subunit